MTNVTLAVGYLDRHRPSNDRSAVAVCGFHLGEVGREISLHVRVVLDPTRRYQPTGQPPGPTPKTTNP